MSSPGRSAIVVFACDPRIEAARKPLLGAHSVAVHAALLADTVERFRPVADVILAWRGDDARAWSLSPRAMVAQRGRGFGQRLDGAVRDAFALGYRRLALVGADCPALTAAEVHSALDQLGQVDAVIGPARDGGINLLAIADGTVAKLNLEDLPWETERLGDALRQAVTTAGLSLRETEQHEDVDRAISLERFLDRVPDTRLARLVRRALDPRGWAVRLGNRFEDTKPTDTRPSSAPSAPDSTLRRPD